MSAADAATARTSAKNAPAAFPLTKDELEAARANARSASPVTTHKYDQAGFLAYLRTLNAQFVGLEGVALLISQFEKRKAILEAYEANLDACIDVKKLKLIKAFETLCAPTLASAPPTMNLAYDFADMVVGVETGSNLPSAKPALDGLVTQLQNKADAIAVKEAEVR